MKTFVTGGSGFIGGNLVERLIAAGHDVVCLVRPTSDVRRLQALGAALLPGDVTDKASLAGGMKGCDWVAHLAGCYEFWLPDPAVFTRVNIEGTRNVLEAALEAGVSKVVDVSTAVTYGDAAWPVTEASPMGRRWPTEYSRTKAEGERIARALHAQRGLPLVLVQPGAVLGPNDPKPTGRYLRDLVRGRMPAQVLTGQPFPFVHVRDVCQAVLKALEKPGTVGQSYLVAAENLTFGAINCIVAELSGRRLPIVTLPDAVTCTMARGLTLVASLTRRPPWLGLSSDQARLMRWGLEVDGSKATRELGIVYTPVREAIREALAAIR
jgi:dihydroflavonol-4-reductase